MLVWGRLEFYNASRALLNIGLRQTSWRVVWILLETSFEWAPECVDSLWSLDIHSSGRYPVKAMKAPVNEE